LALPTGIAYDDLRSALAAIERVHGISELPGIPVHLTRGLRQRGQFSYDRETGAPISIVVRGDQAHRAWSFVREFGHYLDLTALERGPDFGSSVSPKTINWNAAVASSRAIRRLLVIWERGAAPVVDSDGTRRIITLGAAELEFVGTLLLPEEVFARSYVQYVALQSANGGLRRSLAAFREPRAGKVYYPMRWQDDDFVAIALAIDDIFEELGWRL